MKKWLAVSSLLVVFGWGAVSVLKGHDPRARVPMRVPDILGFQTLKCDFHTHTVFSDGKVWPDIRAEEAWREGLDVVAITDHIEYQPHKDDLPTSHNRSYEIARPHGDALSILVLKGSEITRDMPPGHLNAIFLTDSEALDVDDWRAAVQTAFDQGAFIFWNHPGWSGQQPDGVARWYPEHTELVEEGFLHGIEVVNEREYYPEAHAWCLEKNLTMLANSDIHAPIHHDYLIRQGDHRPITLVFAQDNRPESIREALVERRTAAYSGNVLVGEERFLRAIFEGSIELSTREVMLEGRRSVFVQISNESDIGYQLTAGEGPDDLQFPTQLELQAGRVVLLPLRSRAEDLDETRQVTLRYTVENLKVEPGRGMQVEFTFSVRFVPTAAQD